jgi:Glyoxalase-like domain
MIGFVNAIALDGPDPLALARFYQRVLGGDLDTSDSEWVELDCGLGRAKLTFQRSTSYVPPTFPDPNGSQQAHLDIRVDDVGAAEPLVLAAGATKVEGQQFEGFRVYLDPVGHPFCLVRE